MDLSGLSSPRSDRFPAGLRVLVVDDDATWLKILEKMLKKCSYEVTTRSLARDALSLLRERKDAFDIVISDVTMPDMDGFKLLEHVGLEMDLPVIMMSVDGETSRVMKGVQHGACDYLLKPIRMKELRNIWQHVYRKKRMQHDVRDVEEVVMRGAHHGPEPSDDFYVSARDLPPGKRRKYADSDGKNDECGGLADHSHPGKRSRVVWTVDLHHKFVRAVNQIGFEKVGPKKILDLMGVPRLTRENVASHLQKYRLYLSRLEKEDELKEDTYFGGNQQRSSDRSPEDFDPQQKISTLSCDSKEAKETSLVQDKADVSRNADPLLDSSIKYPRAPDMMTSSIQVQKLESECRPQLNQVVSTPALFSGGQPDESPSLDFQTTGQNQRFLWAADGKTSQENLVLDAGLSINLWDEEFDAYSSQVGFYPHIDGGTGQNIYATFSCEYLNDTVDDCSTVDQGLFVYSLT